MPYNNSETCFFGQVAPWIKPMELCQRRSAVDGQELVHSSEPRIELTKVGHAKIPFSVSCCPPPVGVEHLAPFSIVILLMCASGAQVAALPVPVAA